MLPRWTWLLPLAGLVAGQMGEDKCIPITVKLCSDVLYNNTYLPNMLGHTSLDKVSEDLVHYAPLIKTDCSKKTKFFICSLFVPMCAPNYGKGVTACRSVCQSVHDSCIKTLLEFGFNWPATLNCSLFPDQAKGEVCMHQPDDDETGQGSSGGGSAPAVGGGGAVAPAPRQRNCAPGLVTLSGPTEHRLKCAPLCDRHHSFAAAHKAFAEIWMGVWAGLCVLVTLATVLTCALDNVRFRFPERSIIYLALCYLALASAYLARLALGGAASSCGTLTTGERFLVSGGLENVTCVVLFMVVYYFWAASQMWWVVLSGAWYLAARKKWSTEAIEALGSYFHLFAWGVPAVLAIAVLVGRLVDASELTGLCLVGNSDSMALATFLIAPLSLTLLLGLALNLGGFCGLSAVRSKLKADALTRDLAKLERLMTRIAVFSLLYVIPNAVLIGCLVLELRVLRPELFGGASPLDPALGPPRQNVQLHMLRIFMTLIVGITSGVWVFSRKTLVMWEKFLCCGRGPLGAKAAKEQEELFYPLYPQPPGAPQPMASSAPLRLHSASSSYSGNKAGSLHRPPHSHPLSHQSNTLSYHPVHASSQGSRI